MNRQRAKEIVSSPVMINVTHNGNQVYIENVSENKNTAQIHYLNQPENRQEVSLDNLIEH